MSTDEDVTELRDRARRVRALSYQFHGDTAEQLRVFADELEQRARDLEAGGPMGKTSGET